MGKKEICEKCKREKGKCELCWEKYHRGLLDEKCYDDNGQTIV